MRVAKLKSLVVLGLSGALTMGLSGCLGNYVPESELLTPPEGFNQIEDVIAIKNVEDEQCAISMFGCQQFQVFAIKDCPAGVYMELQVLDASGQVIGMTNDYLPNLSAGQTALLELTVAEQNAASTKVTELSCN